MSSIRERAAALNLAEKLCVRPQGHGVSTRPVQSSLSVWSSLIAHLRSTVKVKRRRLHLKSHSDCFPGSEAADVLQEHLVHVAGLQGGSVSRDRVVCVCQALLECGVFEAVGTKVLGKEKKRDTFQDSRGALYRFVDGRVPSVEELEKGALVNGIHRLFCMAPPDRDRSPNHLCPHLVHSSTPLRHIQMGAGVSSGLTELVENLSLSPGRTAADSHLPESLVDEVWQEQTLIRLLHLVELPLLDGILQCIQSPSSPPTQTPTPTQTDPDLICSSNHLERQILRVFRESQEDEWLRAALDCLDFLPDQLVVEFSRGLPNNFSKDEDGGDWDPSGVWRFSMAGDDRPSAASAARCKLLLFDTLLRHYSGSRRTPLLPQHMSDVCTAVTQLLVAARLSEALEALQLCLKLLPPRRRDELRRLLTFMSVAAEPDQVQVDLEVENKLTVRKGFSRAVLHSKTMTREQEDLLLAFMLSNIQEIFKIPGALHKLVSEKLDGLVRGKQPDVTGSTFSRQQDSTRSTTDQELWNLLSSIHLNLQTSSKERRRLLRQFQLAHPQIFQQYFGDSAHLVL